MNYRVCTNCERRRQEKFFSGDRGRVCSFCKRDASRRATRKRHLAETYDITLEEYDEILSAQHGVCAICDGDRPYNLAVDHAHDEAELWGVRASIRGLVCKRCNKILRDVRDDRMILTRAVRYLDAPPARKVLHK